MGYFGIPFRNGVPIGLGSIAGFGAPQEFSPSELFLGGTAGAWYDPSDLTTLFTTSAGTTQCAMPGDGAAVSVGRMLDKSGNGNHAIAFNDTTARPELRARVNSLTYSEDFSNADWAKVNATVSANAGVAPDGTNTADLVYPSSSGNYRGSVYQTVKTGNRLSVCAKAAGFQWLYFVDTGGTAAVVWFDVLNGITGTVGAGYTATITSLGNGWYRCTVEAASGNFPSPQFGPSNADNSVLATASGTNGLLFWGADLRPANIGANVPAYQRIADANTYDTSGFPLYLRFDGIDDSMYTPANLNLSGTDKVSVFAGVRKLSDASLGVAMETSTNSGNNDGALMLTTSGQVTPGAKYGSTLRGTALIYAETATAYAAPRSDVLALINDIAQSTAATEQIMRISGAQVALTFVGANAGTGNLGTYPLFIGSRNNASFFLNGHLHSLIIAGSAVSAGNISATEQWVAGKVGIVI